MYGLVRSQCYFNIGKARLGSGSGLLREHRQNEAYNLFDLNRPENRFGARQGRGWIQPRIDHEDGHTRGQVFQGPVRFSVVQFRAVKNHDRRGDTAGDYLRHIFDGFHAQRFDAQPLAIPLELLHVNPIRGRQ